MTLDDDLDDDLDEDDDFEEEDEDADDEEEDDEDVETWQVSGLTRDAKGQPLLDFGR